LLLLTSFTANAFFELAGRAIEIGLSLKPNQVSLVQLCETLSSWNLMLKYNHSLAYFLTGFALF